jgi:hypothetical protein
MLEDNITLFLKTFTSTYVVLFPLVPLRSNCCAQSECFNAFLHQRIAVHVSRYDSLHMAQFCY